MNDLFRSYIMAIFVFIAGVIHLIYPDYFLPAIPPFITIPYFLIYSSGILEIILAILLLQKKTQDFAAKSLALYFLILIPVHIYVSYFGIEIFGINNKIILWARTGLQFILYFWALSLQTKSWVIQQIWRDVMFIHYHVSPEKIRDLVPFELDLYENKAILTIVPFYMDGIRFPFLPSIPKLSNLWELNIRTYVNVNGVKGIYFFTLETDSKISEIIARFFFHLPYCYSKIETTILNGQYSFKHSRDHYAFDLEASLLHTSQRTDLNLWATERYSLFTHKNGKSYQGIVNHIPWDLTNVTIKKLNNKFTQMVVPEVGEIIGACYAQEMRVSFKNFIKLS